MIKEFMVASLLVMPALAKDPSFLKGQRVKYKVPKFYSLVCKDTGEVNSYMEDAGRITYIIYPDPIKTACPYSLEIPEKDITAL